MILLKLKGECNTLNDLDNKLFSYPFSFNSFVFKAVIDYIFKNLLYFKNVKIDTTPTKKSKNVKNENIYITINNIVCFLNNLITSYGITNDIVVAEYARNKYVKVLYNNIDIFPSDVNSYDKKELFKNINELNNILINTTVDIFNVKYNELNFVPVRIEKSYTYNGIYPINNSKLYTLEDLKNIYTFNWNTKEDIKVIKTSRVDANLLLYYCENTEMSSYFLNYLKNNNILYEIEVSN